MDARNAVLWVALAMQMGCSTWFQDPNTVLVKEPGASHYTVHQDIAKYAKDYWGYVALAANAYELSWPDYKDKLRAQNKSVRQKSLLMQSFDPTCERAADQLITVPGWYAWTGFPDRQFAKHAELSGLFFSVWEYRGPKGVSQVAIVFRGTNFDQHQDWTSNFRWFIPDWLRNEDQYSVTRDQVAPAFAAELSKRIADGRLPSDVKVVAIGHSLGGGLAHQLAYAFPRSVASPLKVSQVIAFNSSPVTGWFSTPNPPRTQNTEELAIDQIFEHGEALAYLRLPIDIIKPPGKGDPAVRDVRFDLQNRIGGIRNHNSRMFACRLAQVAGEHPFAGK